MQFLEGSREYDDVNIRWIRNLSAINRYEGKDMIHRPNLWIHDRRVAYNAQLLAQMVNNLPSRRFSVDAKKAYRMGWRHDDHEMIDKDVDAELKSRFTSEQLQQLKADQRRSARALAQFFYQYPQGSEAYATYINDQEEIIEKDPAKMTLEAQVVNIADKWDAVGEILHDIRCGNKDFAKLLSFQRQRFSALFNNYPFWDDLLEKYALGYGNIPSEEEVEQLPTISIDTLVDRAVVDRVMSVEGTVGLPGYYRAWAEINRQIFDKNPEKYIFPGWYLQLWQRWNHYPKRGTTVSGVILP